ncbi:exosortase Y-associated Wzy-like protein [Mucilaginibacter pedocola]|uniref:Oligosaccharide repeat unit polymerase n=1 Tax=Mucilaginibacter pedocola TaxID=1792845 RepID=A0A1S9PB88_9SPHI|nr:hypothetical protein [Mucilaginibacter pedocola]OOQ58087.1 hypothetical protein BC343_10540 [Mucilaginibacter pedocola]
MGDKNLERYIALFIPWILASLFSSDAYLSYWIAWLGSFVIFFLTLTGWVRPIPTDRPIGSQLMRPMFIMHIIFAGYTCCTSIFYFFSVLGYDEFQAPLGAFTIDKDKLELTAQCQRYYCLGHAAFISGLLMFMKYPKKQKYYIEKTSLATLLLKIALISLPLSNILTKIPGLSQFSIQFSALSFIAGTLALAFAIPLKKTVNTVICGILYVFNFYISLTSGFKEPIIISVLVLGIFLYPNYKKLVLITFVPALFLLFIVLPAYVNNFRATAWSGDASADDAAQQSLDVALESDNTTTWAFLTIRLSEIDMFTNFVKSTPETVDYYGTKLLEQSAIAIVPRIFWQGKPITEDLVMERVYNAGVVNKNSKVSAKPAYIVDGYLSAGTFGVFLSMFLYGAIAQLISNKAEELFGGYILGTALIFSGLFQIFWRGLSFEFIINSVFWDYMSMLGVFHVMIRQKILKKV